MDQETTSQALSNDSDPFESISNFFNSGAWTAVSLLVQVFIVALWLALIFWTYRDARRRIEENGWIAASVALSVVIPYLGTLIYLVVRPPEYIEEARERELELLALERRLGELGDEEGSDMVARMREREGMSSEPSFRSALREAGVPSRDEVRDLDMRLTALEQQLGGGGDGPPSAPPPAAPEPDLGEAETAGSTGRFRLRRHRGDDDV